MSILIENERVCQLYVRHLITSCFRGLRITYSYTNEIRLIISLNSNQLQTPFPLSLQTGVFPSSFIRYRWQQREAFFGEKHPVSFMWLQQRIFFVVEVFSVHVSGSIVPASNLGDYFDGDGGWNEWTFKDEESRFIMILCTMRLRATWATGCC